MIFRSFYDIVDLHKHHHFIILISASAAYFAQFASHTLFFSSIFSLYQSIGVINAWYIKYDIEQKHICKLLCDMSGFTGLRMKLYEEHQHQQRKSSGTDMVLKHRHLCIIINNAAFLPEQCWRYSITPILMWPWQRLSLTFRKQCTSPLENRFTRTRSSIHGLTIKCQFFNLCNEYMHIGYMHEVVCLSSDWMITATVSKLSLPAY